MDLDGIIDAIPYPALIVGVNGRVSQCNAGCTALIGHDIKGRHFISALRQPALLQVIEACIEQGTAGTTTYLDRNSAVESKYRVHVRPVTRIMGRQDALLTFEDITAAQEISQIRRDFVANVSHELRTPLTAILGFIDTLQGPARDDPKARDRFLDQMSKEAERMNRLIFDLLSLSRVESDQRLRPTDPVDLTEILRSVEKRFEKVAQDAGVDVTLNMPAQTAEIKGDQEQLIQVFANLVENAIKYGARVKGALVTINVTEDVTDQQLRTEGVRVDVIDQGEGISPLDVPRLTERFYRVDSHRSREMGGTGLGLAIVKHIVNRHRGRLSILSTPGQGSTFSVFLPFN